MKNVQFLLVFMIIASFGVSTTNASDRKFISRQIQCGLMEKVYALAHAKDPVTQPKINQAFADLNLNVSEEEKYKVWSFAQALRLNPDLNSCFVTNYTHIAQPQEKLDPKTKNCQNMIHSFIQAQKHSAMHQSEK